MVTCHLPATGYIVNMFVFFQNALDKEGKIADNTDELQADLIESEEDQRQGYEVEPVVVKVQVDDKNIEQIVDLKNMKGGAGGLDDQVQPLDNSYSDDDGEPPWEIDPTK